MASAKKDPTPPPGPYPRLDDVVQGEDVAKKDTGKYTADYVNWARIAHYMREHAPGWQPFMERDPAGNPYHRAPNGSIYLLIGFRHPDPEVPDTEPVVHAVMDHGNNAKQGDRVDARDISDAFVRGTCKAAAMQFGLGWKLWSKDDPMEREDDPPPQAAENGGGSREKPSGKSGGGSSGPSTEAQQRAIYAKTRALGMDEEAYAIMLDHYGVQSDRDLTRAQASHCLDQLAKEEKRRAG